MKVAITYDHGMIFQHFGKTQYFKVYTMEDNTIVNAQVISSDGKGHGALAGVLEDANIDALICGGIGQGAINALSAKNIVVYGGNNGDCEMVIRKFLNGQLEVKGANCNHHDHGEDHTCGDHGCH